MKPKQPSKRFRKWVVNMSGVRRGHEYLDVYYPFYGRTRSKERAAAKKLCAFLNKHRFSLEDKK